MAAPHVTGVAALVASYAPSLAADPIALRARLLATGKSMPATVGWTATGRIVDAYRALDATGPTALPPIGASLRQGLDPRLDEGPRPGSAGRPRPTT